VSRRSPRSAKALEPEWVPRVARVAASRLEDKSSAVRKYAAQLVGALLRFNPFGPALAPEPFRARLEAVGGQLKVEL